MLKMTKETQEHGTCSTATLFQQVFLYTFCVKIIKYA